MLNPETRPCSIEKLFNVPTAPIPLLAAGGEPIKFKRPATITGAGAVTEPAIEPVISEALEIKTNKRLSLGWWILIGVGAAAGIALLINWQKKRREKKQFASAN